MKNILHIKIRYNKIINFVFMIFISLSFNLKAELKEIADTELKSVTGQAGFTDFSINGNTARIFVDIHMETYTEIDSMKIAYYDDGSNGMGWDNDWTNVSIGSSVDDPMKIDGLVFRAEFDDINSVDKKLNRIVFGSNRLQGHMVAMLNTFSGRYNKDLISGELTTSTYERDASLGLKSFYFNSNNNPDENMGLFFILTLTGSRPGFQVVAGFDETTVTPAGEWWNTP